MTSCITAPTTDELFRALNIIDEYSRECLAIRVKRKLNSTDVVDALTDLFILRGAPGYIRSDNGPEFVAEAVRKLISAVGAKTAYIEPGSHSGLVGNPICPQIIESCGF